MFQDIFIFLQNLIRSAKYLREYNISTVEDCNIKRYDPGCSKLLEDAFYCNILLGQVLGPSIGLHQKFCKALRLRCAGGKTHSISASAAANTTAPACNTAVGQYCCGPILGIEGPA